MNPALVVSAILPVSATTAAQPLALDRVYAEYFGMVWRLAQSLGIPASSVEDVVQDVFVVVHRRLPEFDAERASLRSWLYGIVVRVVRDHRRTFRRKGARLVPLGHEGVDEGTVASTGPAPSELAERREAFALVCALLDQLDEDKRELLVLSELEEMTAPEIARVLGANVQTVYSRLRAARRAFDEAHARYLARSSRRRPCP
jgi:RNA polymerase sigma-70 factor (ECF subfamily)